MNEKNTINEVLDRESGYRVMKGKTGWLIASVAVGWSLFQLSLPSFVLLGSEIVRSVHLAFALMMVFLCYPAIRGPKIKARLEKSGSRFSFLTSRDSVTWFDIVTALVAAAAALYIVIDYEGIAGRMGRPEPRDMVAGVILVVLLLEAARRALGLALPIIATLFITYSFISEYMPDIIAFKNSSLSKVVSKLTLTTEGIYGIPLDVAASIVFLFVLFGAMLDRAGGGRYFIDLACSLLGGFRGGPAKAAVLASGLTGMVNGSSIANTVTTGTFTIPLMKKSGYPAIKAGAIEVAASTNGQLMPPIMGAAAFIIAEYCNVSYLEVVRAAFIPAMISYLALIYIVHLEACKLGLKRIPREELPSFHGVFWKGIHFLIPLFFLVYQLVILRHSAALAAYHAILALGVLMILRHVMRALRGTSTWQDAGKEISRELIGSLIAGARNMMGIGVAVAAAGIIVGIVTLGLGNVMTELIDWMSGGNLVAMLVITAVVSLILGMGLPTTANYIVMASLTAPAIMLLSHNAGLMIPVLAAHLFVFYFGILSDDTPPVGLSAYAASAISQADPIRTGIQGFIYDMRTAILPFLFIFNTDLLLIGIDNPWHILAIFITGMVAMFAFAAATQGYFRRKNNLLDTILLIMVIPVIMCPWLMDKLYPLGKFNWYLVGIALFASIYTYQYLASVKTNAHRTTS
ncbi:MAG TPA: TRAP transporter permease [Kiritimatiellia bacterium]|nr:TRAP transporter permease [Kiritimatiellia bacterium]